MTSVTSPIRFVDLGTQVRSLQPELDAAIARVLANTDFILGAAVGRFETAFASYCGVSHAIGTDSGLGALELALRAMEIGPGDEVITQANTFIATAGAIMSVGAVPTLVDCDEEGQIRADLIEAAITPRTRAIMPVHLFGCICDIDAVLEVAARHDLKVIEDACQAHGATWSGKRAGSFGDAAAFSFYPGKNLGAFGDGGALVTNDDGIAERARVLRNYGSRVKYEHVDLPLNHRLDTLQAAVLEVKLPRLDDWNRRRQEAADLYREVLQDLPLRLPRTTAPGRHVYHLFVVETEDRDGLRGALQEGSVECGIHYPIPLHLQPILASLGKGPGSFPMAERLASHSLSLPMYPEIPEDAVARVAAVVKGALSG
jgi:dTDP-4-amino-4,6-dideoxygalactose transaminase